MDINKISSHFKGIIGPATIITAGAMGTGSTASLLLSGAWFRYDLLWVTVFILPLYIVMMDSASRVGVQYGNRGMLSVIREHFTPYLAWLIFFVHIPLHFLLVMGNMSIMTSSLLAMIGINPANPLDAPASNLYQHYEIGLSVFFALGISGLMVSGGYAAIRNILAALVFLLFICFCLVAISGFSEWRDILAGLWPQIPDSITAPGSGKVRSSHASIIALAGAVIAPSAILGISYMSTDNNVRPEGFQQQLRSAIINYGLVFGGYSVLVLIAGAYALHKLPGHAEIELVHEAGRVLSGVFPEKYNYLSNIVFSVGLFLCALTTLVVVVQISAYFCLDILGKNWRYLKTNRPYIVLVAAWTMIPSIIAPLWQFPALLKIVLIIGVNLVIAPGIIVVIILLINNKEAMKSYRAGLVRNGLLLTSFVITLVMGVAKVFY